MRSMLLNRPAYDNENDSIVDSQATVDLSFHNISASQNDVFDDVCRGAEVERFAEDSNSCNINQGKQRELRLIHRTKSQ